MAKVRLPDLALDLGTSHARVIGRTGDLLTEIPSAVALRGHQVVAHGEAALRMLGRSPPGVEVIQPIRGGVVTDYRAAEHLIAACFDAAGVRGLRKPRVLVALGAEASEVERRAAMESLRAAGARDVAVVDRMVAAGLGSGLPVTEAVGHLLADLGAGGSRAAILSLGAAVVHHASPTGGAQLNEAIHTWLRDQRKVVVEPRTAENLKQHLVDLSGRTVRQTRIRGREPGSERPREESVGTPDLVGALEQPVRRICEAVRDVLRRASPELSADLLDRGLLLCGGGAALVGLADVLRDDIGLAVLQVDRPDQATIRGCQYLLDDSELYRQLVGGER